MGTELEPPEFLTDIPPNYDRNDFTRFQWFAAHFYPPMFAAYEQWLDVMLSEGSDEVRERWHHLSELRGLDYWVRLQFLHTEYHVGVPGVVRKTEEELTFLETEVQTIHAAIKSRMEFQPEKYAADIGEIDCSEVTADTFEHMCWAWVMGMLSWSRWNDSISEVPMSIDLNTGFGNAMPAYIHGSQFSLEGRFGRRYYVASFGRNQEFVGKLFDHWAGEYEQFADMGLKGSVFERIFELLGLKEGEVLDIGSGTGLASGHKAEAVHLTGIDISANMCELARMRGGHKAVYCTDAQTMPMVGDSTYDGGLLSFVEIWLAEKEGVFAEIGRKLKPNGQLVFNVHDPVGDWRERWQALLSKCGFASVRFVDETIQGNTQSYDVHYVVAKKGES
jgi:predicted TPR repeat methyltransferase